MEVIRGELGVVADVAAKEMGEFGRGKGGKGGEVQGEVMGE